MTAGLTGRARNSATSSAGGRPRRNEPEPKSTLSAIVDCPNRSSGSQPVPGSAKYFGRCAASSRYTFGYFQARSTASSTQG